METIVKLPIYLKVETAGNVDRAKVTKLIREAIAPRVINQMKKGFTLNRLFSIQELQMLKDTLGSGAEVDLLTEVQAMAKSPE